MNLTRLIYASTATGPTDEIVIKSILDSSRRFNSKRNVTGMLCEGNARFIQYIEGERSTINELYAKILSDTRHKNLMLLEYGPIDERSYIDWSMGFVTTQNKDVMKLIQRSTGATEFFPEHMTAWQALSFINAVKEQLYPQIVVEMSSPADGDRGNLH